MLNAEYQGKSDFEAMTDGSVSNHFAAIESVLLKNECISGRYDLTTAASYASNTPVDSPGFTKVCISANGSVVADLENSYIEADLEFTLQYNGTSINDKKACIPTPGAAYTIPTQNGNLSSIIAKIY